MPIDLGRGEPAVLLFADAPDVQREVAVGLGDELVELALRRFSGANPVEVGALGQCRLLGGTLQALDLRGVLARRLGGLAMLARAAL